jgi:hypothetical protein
MEEAMKPCRKDKIFLLPSDGPRRKATNGGDHALIDGACQHCGAAPFKAAGAGKRPSADDRAWEADAVAICCNRHVGILRVEVNTLFGVREDEAVSRLGIRIY